MFWEHKRVFEKIRTNFWRVGMCTGGALLCCSLPVKICQQCHSRSETQWPANQSQQGCSCSLVSVGKRSLSLVWLVCEQWEYFSGWKHILLPTPWRFEDACQGFSYPTGIQGRIVEKANSILKKKLSYGFWIPQANLIANLVHSFAFFYLLKICL